MPKNRTGSIAGIVSDFVDQLTGAIEDEVFSRAREAVLSAVGGGATGRGPGRPPAAMMMKRGPGRPPTAATRPRASAADAASARNA